MMIAPFGTAHLQHASVHHMFSGEVALDRIVPTKSNAFGSQARIAIDEAHGRSGGAKLEGRGGSSAAAVTRGGAGPRTCSLGSSRALHCHRSRAALPPLLLYRGDSYAALATLPRGSGGSGLERSSRTGSSSTFGDGGGGDRGRARDRRRVRWRERWGWRQILDPRRGRRRRSSGLEVGLRGRLRRSSGWESTASWSIRDRPDSAL